MTDPTLDPGRCSTCGGRGYVWLRTARSLGQEGMFSCRPCWACATTLEQELAALRHDLGRIKEHETELMNELAAAKEREARMRAELINLCAAEKSYRMHHDQFGDGDIRTGRAWDKMRRAGDAACEALGETQ